MKTRNWFALTALIGLGIGVGSDEVLHAFRERKSAEFFQQRIRCRHLADNYANKESSDFNSFLIDKVDFSPVRNSCIASASRVRAIPNNGPEWTYQTVDIVTGEVFFIRSCYGTDEKSPLFCGNGYNMKLMDERDKALEAALHK
jgi:hypothetical protein